MTKETLHIIVGTPATESGIYEVARDAFADIATQIVEGGAPLMFMYATDERAASGVFAVHAVFGLEGSLATLHTRIAESESSYPSLTKTIMAAHWFERLIHDQFGLVAEGHPDWRRLIHHENIPEGTHPLRKEFKADTVLAHAAIPYPMHRVEGRGIYEIPVGPIHAGIIEPGHFRFNVRGERIITLEGKLFFKHKGTEKLAEGKTPAEALPLVERVSGDMVVGHVTAYAEAVERATGTMVSPRAKALRVLWGELERVTAHIFDIGNMGGMGTGFTFMAAQGFRLVEELRRMHETLVGHRFLRGAVVLGGAHDVTKEERVLIEETLKRISREIEEVVAIAYNTDGLKERFETTGILSNEAARAYGARGVPARASGVTVDMRISYPYAAYSAFKPTLVTEKAGDVAARFALRVRELRNSLSIITDVLNTLPEGQPVISLEQRRGEALGWSESFRGAVIDFVRINDAGRIERLAISDPSFCNWPLFGEIGPGNIVPDFPLCNKSLNLSYSGTDL